MSELTNNEHRLLKQAADSPRGGVSVTIKGTAGVADARSLRKLFNQGLVADKQVVAEHETRRGMVKAYLTVTCFITEAGRKEIGS